MAQQHEIQTKINAMREMVIDLDESEIEDFQELLYESDDDSFEWEENIDMPTPTCIKTEKTSHEKDFDECKAMENSGTSKYNIEQTSIELNDNVTDASTEAVPMLSNKRNVPNLLPSIPKLLPLGPIKGRNDASNKPKLEVSV